jgi:heme oxygenase
MDDFGTIEDLDSLDDIDEFSEAHDVEEEFYQESEEEIEQNASDDGFNEDYHRFSLIQNAVNHYYKDPKYKSDFVEMTYIADSVGITPDLKRYLEEEMFFSVYIRKIDLVSEISILAQEEIFS